jgi:hypothetical protein
VGSNLIYEEIRLTKLYISHFDLKFLYSLGSLLPEFQNRMAAQKVISLLAAILNIFEKQKSTKFTSHSHQPNAKNRLKKYLQLPELCQKT